MRLNDLRVFVAVHDYGGFQNAANVQGVTQSAVTKTVRKLESHYDVMLIERGSRATLTPAGRALYERAKHLLDVAVSLEKDMLGEKAALTGIARLGSVPALLQPIVLPVLRKALRKHEAARFNLSVKLSSELLTLVSDGRLDLAVAFDVERVPPDVVSTTLGTQLYQLVTRSSGPLAGRSVTIEELSRAKWLLPLRDVALRRIVEKAFGDAGHGPLDVRVETDTGTILTSSLVCESDLVAVMADQSYRSTVNSGLTVVQTALPPLLGRVALYYRRRTPSTGLFVEMKRALVTSASAYFSQGPMKK